MNTFVNEFVDTALKKKGTDLHFFLEPFNTTCESIEVYLKKNVLIEIEGYIKLCTE
jgi:hypothetical protein